MKKLLIVLIGLGIVLIISTRMWIHFFPVEPISEYVEPVIEEKVVATPATVPVIVKPKPKPMPKSKSKPLATVPVIVKPKPKPMPKSKSKPFYKCDKRKYCSQMRSYAEAKYFNDHCPGTRMDGDRDGIPCERQFGR